MTLDYFQLFASLVSRLTELQKQKTDISIEFDKVKQLLISTFPLLPEDKQKIYEEEIAEMEANSAGLLDAVKLVFSKNKGKWLSAPQVRDLLIENGFDLKQYRANPLASIGTTLRRLTPEYLESDTIDDTKVYQRRITLLDQLASESYAAAARALGEGKPLPLHQRIARRKGPLYGE